LIGGRSLQRTDRVEYKPKSAIEPRLELSDPLHEIGVLAVEPPAPDERTHDFDIDGYCSGTAQDTREHRDTLFRKRAQARSTAASPAGFEVAICDFKRVASARPSRNMKSFGKRSRLRLTASFKRFVLTPYRRARSASSITRTPRNK
jgi:hypothetical protein